MLEEQKCSLKADVRCRCRREEPRARANQQRRWHDFPLCLAILRIVNLVCPLQWINSTHDSIHVRPENSNTLLAVLCPVVTIGLLALLLLFCIRRQGDEACFKHVLQLCNEGVKDGSPNKAPGQQQTKEPVGLLPHPLTAANLGPVHVHSAGTVIFSLLNQFTGQGEVAGVERKEERNDRDEEEGRGFQNRAASSPDVHLSQQEEDGETGAVFVPSQEQGKDCHVSKEESL
ncbi:uncharacterized protein si:dkey-260g12.1 [Osmerus eperlanus]|uniref:uncharacterized protein si:dkey-260g12.1 n=1 Tax=Osmerus eperlanus TaxID=29151 RepID=UPI002E106112